MARLYEERYNLGLYIQGPIYRALYISALYRGALYIETLYVEALNIGLYTYSALYI